VSDTGKQARRADNPDNACAANGVTSDGRSYHYSAAHNGYVYDEVSVEAAFREPAQKLRGSGPVKCDDPSCHGHRDRCLFGRPHSWGTPWYKGSVLQHTFHCTDCGGVCTAVDE
jgi:hypothetical protein